MTDCAVQAGCYYSAEGVDVGPELLTVRGKQFAIFHLVTFYSERPQPLEPPEPKRTSKWPVVIGAVAALIVAGVTKNWTAAGLVGLAVAVIFALLWMWGDAKPVSERRDLAVTLAFAGGQALQIGQLSEENARELVSALCRAVEGAHRVGI
jgi:hypothetical protein